MPDEAPRNRRRVLLWSAAGALAIAITVIATIAVRRADGTAKQQAPAGAKATAADAKKKGKPGKNGKEEAPAAPVALAEVRSGELVTWLQTTAVLEPRNSAVLVARRSGPVSAVLHEEGDWVEAGELLARLDDREQRLAVERAELAAEVAKRESARTAELASRGFLSPKEQDDLSLRLRNAQVDLEQARHDLSLTRIVAPFAGRVVERHIKLGETVTVGKTCFELAEFSPLRAKLFFPERELARVRPGQEAELTLDSEPGKVHRARVALVNPVVDRSNGTFKVTLELPNPGGALHPGAFARVRLRTGTFHDVVLVPRRSLMSEDGESYVYLARGDSVVRTRVGLGAIDEDTAQVLSGLVVGDRIVTVGQGGLRQGSRIKAVDL